MKKILITGGFGFLGSHLVEELRRSDLDYQIYIVDNLTSNVVNPKLFTSGKGISYSTSHLKDYLAKTDMVFDEIYHLASIVGPAGVLPFAGKIAQSITDDSYVLSDTAFKHGARLVFVSTSEVYGGGNEGFCQEEMSKVITNEVSARLEYAAGKLAAEIALLNLSKTRNLDVVIVRPFNIAGPRQQATGGFVLPRFLKQAKENEPLTVFGLGMQVRAFTHVADVADGVRRAMELGEKGEVYNIGSEANKTTINDLAELVIEISGSKSSILYIDPQEVFGETYAEANDKFPDSSKARRYLSWHPKHDLRSIITDTINWHKMRDV